MTDQLKLKRLKTQLRGVLSKKRLSHSDEEQIYLLKRNIRKIKTKIEESEKQQNV